MCQNNSIENGTYYCKGARKLLTTCQQHVIMFTPNNSTTRNDMFPACYPHQSLTAASLCIYEGLYVLSSFNPPSLFSLSPSLSLSLLSLSSPSPLPPLSLSLLTFRHHSKTLNCNRSMGSPSYSSSSQYESSRYRSCTGYTRTSTTTGTFFVQHKK